MKNGVSTEERAKVAPIARRYSSRCTDLRKAKPAPRRTIPSAASAIGTYSVVMIAPKASGKAVQRTTRMKISQTWLASQTGVSERWIRARGARPLLVVEAREQVPEPAAEVRSPEKRVQRRPRPENRRREVRATHRPTPFRCAF